MNKNFYKLAIDSDTKRYKKIRKLTSGEAEYETVGGLLD